MNIPSIVQILKQALPEVKEEIARNPVMGSQVGVTLTRREVAELTEYILKLEANNEA